MKKMKRKIRRGFALFLVLVLCLGTFQMTAFAEESTGSEDSGSQTQTETTGGGTAENPTVTVREQTTTTNEDGSTTVSNGSDKSGTTETENEDGSTTTTVVTGSDTTDVTTSADESEVTTENKSETTTTETTTSTDAQGGVTTETTTTEEGSENSTTVTTEIKENESASQDPTAPEAPTDNGEEADVVGEPTTSEEVPVTKPEEDNDISTDSELTSSWLGNGITVTLTPANKTGTVKVEADATATINAIINAAKPEDAEECTDEDGKKGWSVTTTETDEDGNVITTETVTIPDLTYDEETGEVTGYTLTSTATTTYPTVNLETGEPVMGAVKTVTENVKDVDNITTVYSFEAADEPEAVNGVEADEDGIKTVVTENNGTTTTIKVTPLYSEEYYILNEDGTTYSEASEGTDGAVQIVVGYKTDTKTTDAEDNIISESSVSQMGTVTEIVTTPYVTTNSAEWTFVTQHYKQDVTTAVTKTGWQLVEVDAPDGKTYQVWAQMSDVSEGTTTVSDLAGLVINSALLPDAGKTNTDTDIYNRYVAANVGTIYELTGGNYNVRDGAGTNGTNVLYTMEQGTKFVVYETTRIGTTLWGRIGAKQWICLTDANNTYESGSKVAATGQFLYLGEHGLEGAVMVNGSERTDGSWQPHQFIIYDDEGTAHYVYCADFETSPVSGASYTKEVIDGKTVGQWSDNVEVNKDIAQHVQAIALNGYWGTENGTGSLDAVKQMMKEAIANREIEGITAEDVERLLTDGLALTATQAAIWSYATKGGTINTEDPFGNYNLNGNKISTDSAEYTTYVSVDAEKVALALYNYLRGLSVESYTVDEEDYIDADSIVSSSITVKELVYDNDGNPVLGKEDTDNTNTNYVYNTDVSFVLNMEPSKLNGDLLVTIKKEDGTEIGTYRLADAAIDGGEGNFTRSSTDNQTTYTIKDIQLDEHVKITLSLTGTQLIDKSAYLITAVDASGTPNASLSQTFVGVEDQTRNVNVSFDLTFNVREPQVKLVGESTTTSSTTTTEYQKEQTATGTWTTQKDEVVMTVTSEMSYVNTSNTKNYTPGNGGGNGGGTTPDPTPDPDDDDGGDEETTDIPDPGVALTNISATEVPLADLPDMEVPLADIPDEDVPLATIPRTGDYSTLWMIIMLLSGLGLAGIMLTEKREKDEA